MLRAASDAEAPDQSDVEEDVSALAAYLADFLSDRAADLSPVIAAAVTAAVTLRPKATAEELLPGILRSIDLTSWAKAVPAVEAVLEDVHFEAATAALEAFGALSAQTEAMVEAEAKAAARRRAAGLFGFVYAGDELVPMADLPENIADSTRRMLRATIRDAIADAMTDAELVQELTDAYVFSDARAWTIARFEILSAANESTLSALTRINAPLGKEWLTVGDDKVEPICDGNAAQGVIPLHQPFQSGDMSPLAHPNCRCAIRVVRLAVN